MKRIFKVLATQIRWICAIAIVAVIGFSMAACDEEENPNGQFFDDDDAGGYGGGNDSYLAVAGKLTMTDIPAQYNGKYVAVTFGTDTDRIVVDFLGAEKATWGYVNYRYDLCSISSGKVSIPLWKDPKTQAGWKGYTGNDTYNCQFSILSSKELSSKSVIIYSDFSVTFSNGNATKSFDDLTWNERNAE